MNVKRLLYLLLCLWLGGCDQAPPSGQGFAGLGGASDGFAQVTPGRTFIFPIDHGAHPNYRIEWWYLTANLQDDQGQRYGVQWTLFRSALAPGSTAAGWSNRNLWIGHAGLTSASTHFASQTLARGGIGQAGVEAQPFNAYIDDWYLRSRPGASSALSTMDLHARGEGFGYQLQLDSSLPLVLQGQQGYSRKSEQGQASYYYSQPFFTAHGELQIGGRTVKVSGRAWLDREWSSQPLGADQSGWDWFSLHLEGGRQLMLFRLRGSQDFYSGNWIEADGRSEPLHGGDLAITPISSSAVAGRKVPTQWSVKVASKGLDVKVKALNPNAWMNLGTPYWEGPVEVEGSQRGDGYLEMTGY